MAARTTAPVPNNVQYEEMRPKSEWKDENAANVLRIYAHDFKKEQLKIKYVHSTRIIRVTGERQIAGNKWARFDQTFAVPQNCDVNNIHAKFVDGILTITLPKSHVTPSPASKVQPQATAAKTSSQEASAPAAATAGAPATPKPAIPTPSAPSFTQAGPRTTTEGREQKGMEETRKPDVPSAPSLREVLKEMTHGKVREEQVTPRPTPPPPPSSSSSRTLDDHVKQKVDDQIAKKREESSSSPMLAPPGVDTEGVKKRKESSILGTNEEKKKGPSLYPVEEVVNWKMDVRSMAAAAKETVKGRLAMDKGEYRQRLVNVGVAVLVIVAVGAYLYYSYRPSSSP